MPRLFEINEIIYNQNDDVEEMYFIIIGMVEIGYKKSYNSEPKYYHILYNRDYFGGYYNLYNIRSEYIYKAKEESKLYAINKIDFLKLLKKFPIIEKHMRKNVYNKFKRGVKFQMDKSIQKDYQNLEIINEDDNEINTNKKKLIIHINLKKC
jgi:CRP-like cAMP-binding protein